MKITESKLRSIIKSVIREAVEGDESNAMVPVSNDNSLVQTMKKIIKSVESKTNNLKFFDYNEEIDTDNGKKHTSANAKALTPMFKGVFFIVRFDSDNMLTMFKVERDQMYSRQTSERAVYQKKISESNIESVAKEIASFFQK